MDEQQGFLGTSSPAQLSSRCSPLHLSGGCNQSKCSSTFSCSQLAKQQHFAQNTTATQESARDNRAKVAASANLSIKCRGEDDK